MWEDEDGFGSWDFPGHSNSTLLCSVRFSRSILDPLWAKSKHDYQMWEEDDVFKSWDDPRLMQFGINWK